MKNMKTTIRVRVNKCDKEMATKILNRLGLNMSTYINLAIKQLIKMNGVPFEIVLSNLEEDELLKYFSQEELLESAKELTNIEKNLNEYEKNNNWEDLKKEIFKK